MHSFRPFLFPLLTALIQISSPSQPFQLASSFLSLTHLCLSLRNIHLICAFSLSLLSTFHKFFFLHSTNTNHFLLSRRSSSSRSFFSSSYLSFSLTPFSFPIIHLPSQYSPLSSLSLLSFHPSLALSFLSFIPFAPSSLPFSCPSSGQVEKWNSLPAAPGLEPSKTDKQATSTCCST